MSGMILARVVQTCYGRPSQWDAWDTDGNYWYLRYRFGLGSAERQPGPDEATWADKEPEIEFMHGGPRDGDIGLDEFCRLAGLTLAPGLVMEEGGWKAWAREQGIQWMS